LQESGIMEEPGLAEAVERLAAFLGAAPLTTAIAELERRLDGLDGARVEAVTRTSGVDRDLLGAAIIVRRDLGRISDLIHAAAIVLVLPHVLEDGEQVSNRPSLAAGNDPSRPYDLEMNRRVAEFKLSRWVGADAMRKRQTFKDLVHLAADTSGRQPELFIVGNAPTRFLRSSRSTASWALDRSPATRELFIERYGSLEMRIADFTAGPAARVRITDLTTLLPEVAEVTQVV
jgi:hypothetical protein